MDPTEPRTHLPRNGRPRRRRPPRWPPLVALVGLPALVATVAWAAAGPFAAPATPPHEGPALVGQDAPEPDFQRAATLYATTCVACHGPYGSGAAMPGLGIPPLDAQGTAWQKSDLDLQFIIKGGKGSMPGVGGSWSKQDVLDVIALMRTWWTPEQQKQHDALSGTNAP